MDKFSFDLKHTNIAKGFFILAMVFHHVFAPDMHSYLNMGTNDPISQTLSYISFYCKVCVGGFAFLSAYGITKKLMSHEFDMQNNTSVIITRFVKFYLSFWPFFFIGIIGTYLFGETPLTATYINPFNGEFSWILPIVDGLGLSNLLDTPTINVSWWYISVAFFIILVTPLYYYLCKRFNFVFLGVMCILPYALKMTETTIFFAVPALGVAFAQGDWLSKLKSIHRNKIWKRIFQWILPLLLIYVTYELCKSTLALPLLPICTVICMYFCFVCLSDIPILREILAFFGKHSANIFFVHTFLYYYWFSYSIYSLKNNVLIYCAVFIGALLISIVLELLKKIVRYNKLENFIISHLIKLTCIKSS